jgi:hypothetical protein
MAVSRQTTIDTVDGPITVTKVDDWVRLTVNGHPLELGLDDTLALIHALQRAVT